MITGVRKLESLYGEKSNAFGNKANNLSYMMICGMPILPGFCITFDIEEEYGDQLLKYSNEIEKNYAALLNNTGCNSVIVRSSADMEDEKRALFPGVFRSISSVKNLSELFDAIQACFFSVHSPSAFQYMNARNIKYEIGFFTVIVQPELESDYSGVAATQFPIDGYQRNGIMLEKRCTISSSSVKYAWDVY